MKLNLRFLIAAFIVMMIYTSAVQAQARLTFSGGSGAPLSTTVLTPVTYTITNTSCDGGGYGPVFVFDETGDAIGGERGVTGTITFSINGGAAQTTTIEGSGVTVGAIMTNDLYVYGSVNGVANGNTVVLSAGTVTTTTNVAAAPPANGRYTTFLTSTSGVICSLDGVSAAPTAASVSISGKVLIGKARGLANALVYLTGSEGNTRIARTNSLGYYRFEDVQAGQSVTVTVVSKRYQFAPQILNLNEEMSGVNFLADN